jgi:hypothetical protein
MGTPGELLRPKRSNYLIRHWRGDLPLGISYWVNGAILGNLVPAVVLAILAAQQASEAGSLRAVAALELLLIAVSVAMPLWSVVGIWRSSEKHVQRGGKAFWAGAARVGVAFGLLSVVGNWSNHNIGGQAIELAEIAIGHDSLAMVDVKVAPNGGSILLSGVLGTGSAERVRTILAATPDIKLVQLDSIGGRIFEAQAIAAEVRQRRLNTYVTGMCVSACTIIFLAGEARAATPNARIGFHRGSLAGEPIDRGQDPMINVYRKAGISQAFLERVKNTPSESMWYPTREELAANGITTRVSLGGETASDLSTAGINSADDVQQVFAHTRLWQAIERRYPGSTARAADAAWKVHQSGANDSEMESASRSVISSLVPRALSDASPPVLDAFLDLTTMELSAATAVNEETCQALLAGKLNIQASLPKTVVAKDAAVTQLLFESAPEPASGTWSSEDAAAAVRAAVDQLRPEYVTVLARGSGEAGGQTPCPALIAFYQAVAKLPSPQRTLALRSMFQR